MRLRSRVEKHAPAYPFPSPPRIESGTSIQTAETTANGARAAPTCYPTQRRGDPVTGVDD